MGYRRLYKRYVQAYGTPRSNLWPDVTALVILANKCQRHLDEWRGYSSYEVYVLWNVRGGEEVVLFLNLLLVRFDTLIQHGGRDKEESLDDTVEIACGALIHQAFEVVEVQIWSLVLRCFLLGAAAG